MSNKVRLPDIIATPDGRPSDAFREWVDKYFNDEDADFAPVGKLLSGVNQAKDEAELAKVTADAAVAENTVQGAAIAETKVAASGGAYTVTTSASSTFKTRDGAGAVTTDSITGAHNGGTSPYSGAWTKVSGGAIVADSPSADTTTFSSSGDLTIGEYREAVFRFTGTDDAAATDTADVSVAIMALTQNGGGIA